MKLSWKVNISTTGFKLIYFLSINKEIIIMNMVMKTQAKFCLCFTKINTKSVLCFTNVQVISSVCPSANTYNLFLWLSVWNDKLLSTPKLTTLWTSLLPKPAPSNAISLSLNTYFFWYYSFTVLVTQKRNF